MFNVKSDPLDALLFAVGLRLSQLAKSGDSKFKSLLENRNFTIQMGSEAEQVFRTFAVNNGYFTQTADKTENPTLSITFKDSMTGAKLLAKGDAAAFMVGIQNGDLKMAGDYSLLMWFNQVAKFIVPKVPEPLQPFVEQAKPLIDKATPIAKDLFAKASSFFDKTEKTEKTVQGESKFFNEQNTPTNSTTTDNSVLDNLKEKAVEIKEKAEEKLAEVKHTAEEKFDELKTTAETKIEEGKEKIDELKHTAEEKVVDLKATAEEKAVEIKEKAETKIEDGKEKLDELKHTAEEKVADLKATAEEKVEEVKTTAETKIEDGKEKLDGLKATAEEKVDEVNQQLEAMSGENKEETADNSQPPAMTQSQALEAKHADDEVIAENVKTDAVKNNKSPITNITVTRNA